MSHGRVLQLKEPNMGVMVRAGVLSYKRKCSFGKLNLSDYKKKWVGVFSLVTSNYGVWWLHLH